MIASLIKLVTTLLQPVGFLWALTAWLAWRWWRAGLRRPAAWMAGIWAFLTLTTCTVFCDRLLASIEHGWRPIAEQWDTLPQADAIVVLGGGIEASMQEIIGVNMQESSDRPTTAIELLRRGLAPRLLVGGGASPGEFVEAESVIKWIKHWQLSQAELISLGKCRDTHDEALHVLELAKKHGWKRILLVTSASHMNRASATFRKTTGLEVVPVPCAFMSHSRPSSWVHLPENGEFDSFATWFHETVGWYVYRMRGWI